MRRTITALVLFAATLFILQAVPQAEYTVIQRTEASDETLEEWVQTSVADFETGQLECVGLATEEDGEIALAQEQEAEACTAGVFTSRAQGTSVLFNVVGVAWIVDKPMGTTFQAEIRTSSDGKTWRDWMEVVPDEDGPGEEPLTHSNLLEVSPSRYLQYRVHLGTFEAGVSPALEEIVLTMMNTREGPTIEQAQAMILPQEASSGVPQPKIISRKGWGANEAWATREPTYRQPTHFVIHHTVTPNNPEDPAYIVRAIYQYHALSRGWGDIGYNFLIDRQGNIYEGRKGGDGVVGIHAGDYNYGSIGIALLGDYRTAEMTPAMKEALVSLMAWEADRFGINPQESSYFVHRAFPNIVGHRDLWSTVCPGDKVYKVLPELRKLVWQRLLANNPRVEIVSPEAGELVSGEVEVQIHSPSPTTSLTRFLLDGSRVAEGDSSLEWAWNTRQFSEGRHRIEAVARSVEGRRSVVAREVIVDNTPPTGSITINDGVGYTSQVTVTLELEAEGAQGEIAGMQFTQDSASEFTAVEEYATSRLWVLGPGDGERTVGVRYVDAAGNVSPTCTASIVVDTDPPGDWSRVQTAAVGQVMVGVADHVSGLNPASAQYSLSPDGGFTWGPWQGTACASASSEAQLSACYLTADVTEGAVRFQIADQAGNQSYSPAYGEVVASPTPVGTPSGSPTAAPPATATPTAEAPPATLPDLVVGKLVMTPDGDLESGPMTVTVTIRNEGLTDASDGFWVELFVDPEVSPSVNSVAVGESEGVLWYVPSLEAGSTMSLSLEDADDRYSSFDGRLSIGRHEFYVYVDAYNTEGEVGLVAEADESNNLLGPLVVEIAQGSPDGTTEPSNSRPGEVLRALMRRLEELLVLLRERL
jgi:hypothetical protein